MRRLLGVFGFGSDVNSYIAFEVLPSQRTVRLWLDDAYANCRHYETTY